VTIIPLANPVYVLYAIGTVDTDPDDAVARLSTVDADCVYGRKVTTAESALRTVCTETTPSVAALDRIEHCIPRYNVPPLYVMF
jgi:hypothetical protein